MYAEMKILSVICVTVDCVGQRIMANVQLVEIVVPSIRNVKDVNRIFRRGSPCLPKSIFTGITNFLDDATVVKKGVDQLNIVNEQLSIISCMANVSCEVKDRAMFVSGEVLTKSIVVLAEKS
jgi:hypothetical protein